MKNQQEFRVEIHENLRRFFSLFYRLGFWHRHDVETAVQIGWKLVFSVYSYLFPLSMIMSIKSDCMDVSIFLIAVATINVVCLIRVLGMIWGKTKFFELISSICNYRIDDRQTFVEVNGKSENFMKFATFFVSMTNVVGIPVTAISPFVGEYKTLFVPIAFPLDWRNDELGFWMAYAFFITEAIVVGISILANVVIWYLMASLSWQYYVLGNRIKEIDVEPVDGKAERRISDHKYRRDLVDAIESYYQLNKVLNEFDSFLSNVFVIQLPTSSLCICGSIYILAFVTTDNWAELLAYVCFLLYSTFDIFMIMFYGNEIKLATNRLSRCLYETNWIDRSQSVKDIVIIFGEFLMQPKQLVVLKLYPLTLATFTTILNSAYSLFNIVRQIR